MWTNDWNQDQDLLVVGIVENREIEENKQPYPLSVKSVTGYLEKEQIL